MDELNYVEIGKRIKLKRKEMNLTQEKLSPSFKFAALDVASSPITSFAIITSLSNNLDNSFATGFNENSGFTSPFGLPKCDVNIILQFCSSKYFIVGSAATILVLSVIFCSLSINTLKSHLTNTFFPFKSMSFTVFLFLLISIKFGILYSIYLFS